MGWHHIYLDNFTYTLALDRTLTHHKSNLNSPPGLRFSRQILSRPVHQNSAWFIAGAGQLSSAAPSLCAACRPQCVTFLIRWLFHCSARRPAFTELTSSHRTTSRHILDLGRLRCFMFHPATRGRQFVGGCGAVRRRSQRSLSVFVARER